MAFLTMIKDVVTELRHVFQREHVVMDFGFLQADDVRTMLFDQCLELMRTGTQPIDVK